MTAAAWVQELEKLLTPAVMAVECELWGVEYLSQGRQSTLRVYIDKADGITVDDCARASRQISGVLHVSNPIADAYRLEVSSPGMDRPLFRLAQYEKYLGERIKVSLTQSIGGRRHFAGCLLSISDDQNLVLRMDSETVALPFAFIGKARLAI